MTENLPPGAREYLQWIGSRGGKAALVNMTAEERSERSRKAVQAREIRRRRAAGRLVADIAAEFGLSIEDVVTVLERR